MVVDCVGVSSATDEAIEPKVRLRDRIVTVEGICGTPWTEDLGEARGGVWIGAGSFDLAD